MRVFSLAVVVGAAVGLAGSILVAAPDVGAADVLAHTGFELLEPAAHTPRWIQAFGDDGYEITDEVAYAGSRSLRIDDSRDDASVGVRTRPVRVEGGRAHAVTARLSTREGSLGVYVTYYDAANRRVAESKRYFSSAGSGERPEEWREIRYVTRAPREAVSASSMFYSGLSGTVEAYVDELHWREAWVEERIGPMNHNTAVSAPVLGSWPDGRAVLYLPLIGTPSHLVAVDLEAGTVLRDLELPGSEVCWTATVTPTGEVYVGCQFGGRLYRYGPGEHRVESLGSVLPGAEVLWGLTSDASGQVFGGVFARDQRAGRVFGFDPRSGKFRDLGAVTTKQPYAQYARDLTVHAGELYVGLGTTGARIFRIDIASGVRREIAMPEREPHDDEVFDLDVRGDLLFARLSPSQRLLVYDLEAQRWQNLGRTQQSAVSPLHDGTVYFVDDEGRLQAYDVERRRKRAAGAGKGTGTAIAAAKIAGLHGDRLVMVDFFGRIRTYDLLTGKGSVVDVRLPGRPGPIHSMAEGPDGRIYTSAYPSGGLAYYDPRTRTRGEYPQGVVPQIEGMARFGGRLYLGKYPGAYVMAFDPAEPFRGGANPRYDGDLKAFGQDRPFAWTTVGDRLAIGTVPDYGHLGGSLALFDPDTRRISAFPEPVDDQSVIALTTVPGKRGPIVVAGTSVWGGMGAAPSKDEARLFGFDPASGRNLWEITPVRGERAITALTVAPDGHVWGLTVGKLFEFDPATRRPGRSCGSSNSSATPGRSIGTSGGPGSWGSTATGA